MYLVFLWFFLEFEVKLCVIYFQNYSIMVLIEEFNEMCEYEDVEKREKKKEDWIC